MSRTKTELKPPASLGGRAACAACTRPIDPAAERCPYCHARTNPTWRALDNIGEIVVAILIVLIVMGLYHGG